MVSAAGATLSGQAQGQRDVLPRVGGRLDAGRIADLMQHGTTCRQLGSVGRVGAGDIHFPWLHRYRGGCRRAGVYLM